MAVLIDSGLSPVVNFGTGAETGPEAKFGRSLARVLGTQEQVVAIVREFSVANLGVADMLRIESGRTVRLTAFELKISNWRRALAQAYRYSYYADYSIVVMPERPRDLNLHEFRSAGVGFWLYDAPSKVVRCLARPQKAIRNPRARAQAIEWIQAQSKLRKLLKNS